MPVDHRDRGLAEPFGDGDDAGVGDRALLSNSSEGHEGVGNWVVRRQEPVVGARDWAMARDVARYREIERRLWNHVGATPIERYVPLASGGRVRVQEVGDGVPFVLIHGGSIAGTSWATLAAALGGIRCLLVDRPGFGLSDPIVGGPLRDLGRVEAYADRLLPELLDALELDAAAVGATSYGGFFAFRGAAAAPERVTRIVEYSWLIGAPSEGAPFAARVSAVPGLQPMMTRLPMSRGMVKQALRQFGLGRAIDSGGLRRSHARLGPRAPPPHGHLCE